MELRFVERKVPEMIGQTYKTIRVLQQKWEGRMREETEGFFRKEIEWRDVPLVKDEA